MADEILELSKNRVSGDDNQAHRAAHPLMAVSDEQDQSAIVAAINRVQAVISFNPDGTILDANKNFLDTLGYSLDEIKGRHHRMFCDAEYSSSEEYKKLWDKLSRGESDSGEYRRIGKGGKEVYINASYNPVRDASGRVTKVVKFAVDVSQQKLRDFELGALSKSQAVIEFNLDGTIIKANDNFLKATGYSLADIRGRHHSIFCDPTYAASPEYKSFWANLGRGEFQSGLFHRLNSAGNDLYLQASYNPVFDLSNRPFKVVKYATDVTKQTLARLEQERTVGRIQSMMENAPINIMCTDMNLRLTYMNPKSRETLKKLEKYLPISVDQMIGADIDIFHKNPAHQRKMLASDKALPHRAQIKVGPETLDLLVSGMYDQKKNYLGPMVTWDIITAKVELVRDIGEASKLLASASAELNATATQMAGNAENTNKEANAVASASEEVARGVQVVATNTEEMVASIKEIARNAGDASSATQQTVREAESTNTTILKLGESSQEIGNVIKVISSIAQQTNLLALNATIEAARAGEAGKGFAVVANEVKELAKQTAKATEDITQRIGGIQKDTTTAVDAIGTITTSVQKINSIATAIAAAVEEQQATTTEVSRVVQESAKGVQSITQSVKTVSSASGETKTGANQVLDAAKSLAELADRLQVLVKRIEI